MAAPTVAGGPAPPQPAGRTGRAWRTTPGRYRLWALAVTVALAAAAVLAALSANRMRTTTARARDNTGPVLVATQQLISSLAEADAAATAAFLSGANEDPEPRRNYEQAIARANQQLENIAALTGDDAATHQVLQTVAVDVTRYAGLIEAARARNHAGDAAAADDLVTAVNLLESTVGGGLQQLTTDTQARLARNEGDRAGGYPAALAALAVALGLLLVVQIVVAARSRRLLNLPLLVALLLGAAALVVLVVAGQRSRDSMASARRAGYDSIAITAKLQTTAFQAKADETLALITNDPGRRAAADQAEQQIAPGGLLQQADAAADTSREHAAVAEVAVRWQRFRDTIGQLRAATGAAARDLAVGAVSSTFNGVNFSVEAVLGQNRDQFLAGLSTAAGATRLIPLAALLIPLAALLAALGGLQLRIREYR